MFRQRYYYLIKVQYLGFRFHGWQKQPEVNTVQRMVERTLAYVLQHKNFKVLAAGRTDAKVSANEAFIELFLDHQPIETASFLSEFNQNLPQDIKALSIEEVDKNFNIIQHPKQKEYIYLFTFGTKMHPFAAPFMYNIPEELNIEAMKKCARLFEGTHNFRSYCHRPNPKTVLTGTIDYCRIMENTEYIANFFPEKSYLLKIVGTGFKRNQIRLMMGALIDVGKGKRDETFIRKTLDTSEEEIILEHIVPGSGLILNRITLISSEDES
ncbi:tRNA pseudouridine(38-40) synthase TruA [Aquimarina sp. ERC-38]|uniref:tRNA pseudouridine(38-40) synthase TruA n=1 Tax=Aquimarina sp. ERC-38 TaxID=2949996 RepID=UPI002246CFF5|nr:tRNA pseudouridine(38-40) synthase TruA [Aquimarina sp. ERC-38]UZO80221.1 tRNA pseudouridine(38-40) synthase TruA [Aquimarina sp. ERC-38]